MLVFGRARDVAGSQVSWGRRNRGIVLEMVAMVSCGIGRILV